MAIVWLCAPGIAISPAEASCVLSGSTVNCTGDAPTGFQAGAGVNGLAVTVQPGATVEDNGTVAIGVNDFNTVTNNGSVTAGIAVGISAGNNNTITNAGTLVSDGTASIFAGNNNVIVNSGTLNAGIDGLFGIEAGNNNTILNTNTLIVGDVAVGIFGGSNNKITNSGTILAGVGGIGIEGVNANTVTNSGTIQVGDGGTGVLMFGDGGSITNAEGGIIRAGLTGGGIQTLGTGLTVVNNGMIIIGDASGSAGFGMFVNAGTTATNNNTIQVGIGSEGIEAAGANNTVTNNGTITTGALGVGIDVGFATPLGNNTVINTGTITVGAGGTGILVDNIGTVFNSGTITAAGSVAIDFCGCGPGNTLTLAPTSVITGLVLGTGNDTFQLGGSGTGTFDVSSIGPTQQYQGFGIFNKIDTSTWILTGATAALTPWTIAGGELSVSSDGNLGDPAGVLTFNGGVLQVTGTAFTSTARTITWGANGGGFDIADANAIFTLATTQGFTGSGNLSKAGPGTLALTADNSAWTGNTTVTGGTLSISSNGNLGAPTTKLALSNGTTLALTSSFTFTHPITVAGDPAFDVVSGATVTISSVIADGAAPGDVAKSGAGTLVLSANDTYTGTTTVSAGTLRAGIANALPPATAVTVAGGATLDLASLNQTIGSLAGAGSVTLGSAVLTTGNDGTSTVFSGAISGSGALAKIGTGVFTLSGTSTYTGETTVANGTLAVDGSIAGSAVTVQNAATLGGHGTVGGIVAQSGGTVAPGIVTPFSTLNVSGNVTFASGSVFRIGIDPAGETDKIAATGKATLQGGTVRVQAAPGTYNPSARYTILTAQGGVSGTFAQLQASANLTFAFLTPTLSYDANDVFLGFTQTATFQSLAQTRNQTATATALQTLGLGNPLFNAVVIQTSAAGARQAFDALSGEVHASAVTAALEDSRLPREAILDRLGQQADVPVLGAASAMTGAYAADLPSGKGPALAPVAVRMYEPRLFGLWGQGFGNWGHTRGDGNAASLTRSTGGFVLGADTVLASSFRLGVAGGYTADSLSLRQRLSSGTFESVFGSVYGGASFGAVQLRAGLIYGANTTSTSRSIVFPGFADAAGSSYGGSTAQAFGEAGYRIGLSGFNVAGLGFSRASLEPFVGAAAIHIHQNGFTEGGGAAALIGFGRSYDLATTTLGVRAETGFAGSLPLTARALLGWRHGFGDVVPTALMAFQGGAQSFSVTGAPIDRDALVAEAGLDYAVSTMVTVGVAYSGQYGQRATDSAFKGHADVRF
ncbi:MAG: autotransporter domain-containing protein [Hyphomicrobiales bacterium]